MSSTEPSVSGATEAVSENETIVLHVNVVTSEGQMTTLAQVPVRLPVRVRSAPLESYAYEVLIEEIARRLRAAEASEEF